MNHRAHVLRPRLLERFRAASEYRVVLVVAPGGYGKSTAVDQFNSTQPGTIVKFEAREHHATLGSFTAALCAALSPLSRDIRDSFAEAQELALRSEDVHRALALWFAEKLADAAGVVVIDDLHLGGSVVGNFLGELLERTPSTLQWILVTRNTEGLPLGTWMAYGLCDLPIDEKDLSFTDREAAELARTIGTGIDDVGPLHAVTGGWPTALTFALRSTMRSRDLEAAGAATREMMYRFLAEQVYRDLNTGERAVLLAIAALGDATTTTLEKIAGDGTRSTIAALRRKLTFLHEASAGTFRLHDLFREYLLHELQQQQPEEFAALRLQCARALEQEQQLERALWLYVQAQKRDEIRRFIETHGLDLITTGTVDVIEQAVAVTRTAPGDALLDAFFGFIEHLRGRYESGLSIMETALSTSDAMPGELRARLILRFATHYHNTTFRATPLTAIVSGDLSLPVELRAEAYAAHASGISNSEPADDVRRALAHAERLVQGINDARARVRILQQIGIAYDNLGDLSAMHVWYDTIDLAEERHMYSLAAAAAHAIARLEWTKNGNYEAAVRAIERGERSAKSSGHMHLIMLNYLYQLAVFVDSGERERAEIALHAFRQYPVTPFWRSFVIGAEAYLALLDDNLPDALRLFGVSFGKQRPDDLVGTGGIYAVILALSNERKGAIALLDRLHAEVKEIGITAPPSVKASIGIEFMRLAETMLQRARMVAVLQAREPIVDHPVTRATAKVIDGLIPVAKGADALTPAFAEGLQELRNAHHGGFATIAERIAARLVPRQSQATVSITSTEKKIIKLLAAGMSTKEIAQAIERSPHTINSHVRTLYEKLGVRSRVALVNMALQFAERDENQHNAIAG